MVKSSDAFRSGSLQCAVGDLISPMFWYLQICSKKQYSLPHTILVNKQCLSQNYLHYSLRYQHHADKVF